VDTAAGGAEYGVGVYDDEFDEEWGGGGRWEGKSVRSCGWDSW